MEETPAKILTVFYRDNHLDIDGGIELPSVKIDIYKNFHIYFPNFDSRRKAVLKHDIHHLLTGYTASDLIGEAEISAWEIGSGCKKYYAAFFINLLGIMTGLFVAPGKVLNAFARGRNSLNLYHDSIDNETALNTSVIKLRELLEISPKEKKHPADFSILIGFAGVILLGVVFSTLTLLIFPLLFVYTLDIIIDERRKART